MRENLARPAENGEWTFEGKLLGGFAGRDLIEAAEASYALCPFYTEKHYVEEVRAVWKPMLATGPKLVV